MGGGLISATLLGTVFVPPKRRSAGSGLPRSGKNQVKTIVYYNTIQVKLLKKLKKKNKNNFSRPGNFVKGQGKIVDVCLASKKSGNFIFF